VPEWRGVGRVHRDDRVLDPPGRAGVLPPDPGPGRARALLQIPGLIEDQHPAAAQVTGDEGAHVIAHGVLVPHSAGQKMPEPVGAIMTTACANAQQLPATPGSSRPRR
jgi:hypothetical protein